MKNIYEKYFIKQGMMKPLFVILGFCSLYSIYLFGWRSLALLLINCLVAVIVELLSNRYMFNKDKVTEAALVSAMLYSLTLPASLPFWISAIGMAFGMFFGKMVFGGFGRNVFNPALVARLFTYINFPNPMTITWNQPATGFPGGFASWLTPIIDDLTQATPMIAFKNTGGLESLDRLILGNTPGVMGETGKVILILAAIYLIYKKVASWEIMVSTLVGFVGTSFLLIALDQPVMNPLYGVLMGGFVFGTVLMATDPISAAKTREGKVIYGLIIGIVTVIIRSYALFSGGMMFAIIIGNIFAPIIDYGIRERNAKKKAKQAAVQGGGA